MSTARLLWNRVGRCYPELFYRRYLSPRQNRLRCKRPLICTLQARPYPAKIKHLIGRALINTSLVIMSLNTSLRRSILEQDFQVLPQGQIYLLEFISTLQLQWSIDAIEAPVKDICHLLHCQPPLVDSLLSSEENRRDQKAPLIRSQKRKWSS